MILAAQRIFLNVGLMSEFDQKKFELLYYIRRNYFRINAGNWAYYSINCLAQANAISLTEIPWWLRSYSLPWKIYL